VKALLKTPVHGLRTAGLAILIPTLASHAPAAADAETIIQRRQSVTGKTDATYSTVVLTNGFTNTEQTNISETAGPRDACCRRMSDKARR